MTPIPPRSREPEESDGRPVRDADQPEVSMVPHGAVAVFEPPRGMRGAARGESTNGGSTNGASTGGPVRGASTGGASTGGRVAAVDDDWDIDVSPFEHLVKPAEGEALAAHSLAPQY